MIVARCKEFKMTRTLVLLRLMVAIAAVKMSVFAMESSFQQQHETDPQRSVSSQHESTSHGRQFSSDPQRDLQSYPSFYTKYDHYPPYCALPEDMGERRIPPLKDYLPKSGSHNEGDSKNKSLIGETRLVHVTAIIRHGARTPWSSELKCWDGYWESPQTGKWDCDDLTTFMAPPSRNATVYDHPPTTPLLFEKKYDALSHPEDGLANVLNGTCQMGQLIQQGYGQQIQNGKILRDAYAYKEGEYEHDERMRLLNINMDSNSDKNHPFLPWQNPQQLYFRADDYQRTIMSGQILLRSLFDPELQSYQETHPDKSVVIPLHIADEDKDILDANNKDCPLLKTIKAEALSSPEYQAFNNSQNSQEVREYMQSKLGMGDDSSPLDCLMCTVCTDRALPDSVDDYDGTEKNWFTRLTEYDIQKDTVVMKYNNAQHSKLAMGPLWYEIMVNINNAIGGKPSPKLALFAGHDTTLMPLLASLGPDLWKDTEWAAYASMMLIEIHELIDGRSDTDIYTSSFAFRLLYNGQILTPLIDGCHEDCELCDIVHLKAIVDPIGTRHMSCEAQTTTPTEGEASGASSSSSSTNIKKNNSSEGQQQPSLVSRSTTTGRVLFATLVLLSMFGGSAVTFSVMRRRFLSKSVDFGGSWDIGDAAGDGEYGLELSEQGGGYR